MKQKRYRHWIILLVLVVAMALFAGGCKSNNVAENRAAFEGGSDDHGDSPSTATSVSANDSVSGNLETGGDVDYFSVDISYSGWLTVATSGTTDTKGYLYDSSLSLLDSDDDGGSGENFQLSRYLVAGTYYIKVTGYSSTTVGRYTLVTEF